jgi:hypothetical protein
MQTRAMGQAAPLVHHVGVDAMQEGADGSCSWLRSWCPPISFGGHHRGRLCRRPQGWDDRALTLRVMKAMIHIWPPQMGHSSGNTS